METKIYNLGNVAKQVKFLLVMSLFLVESKAQNTYTFNYTGSQQTIALQAGTYTIEMWGADGGDNLGNGSSTFLQNGGKGGYSVGTYTLASTTTLYVNVGGKGSNSTTTLNVVAPGGYNGGGYGSLNTTSGKCSGGAGGGATHVATLSGTLGALSTNTSAVLIVAGGGGGAGESNYANNNTSYNSNGGAAGGLSGAQNITSSYQGRHGKGGTQTVGGTGGDNGSAVAGIPLQGIFGVGGYNNISGANSSTGGAGIGGGGGGWYGGGAGWGGGATAYMAGAGGGGSGYIGGMLSGVTYSLGQTGFVNSPILSGNGYVLIRELCSITLSNNVTGNNNVAICAGTSLTLTTNAISNYSWSNGSTASSIVVTPGASTNYSLTATSPSNCVTSKVISVSVSAGVPSLSINSSTNITCLGRTVTLTASGAVTYTWSNGILNGAGFTPTATQAYTVSGQNGCGTSTAVASISIAPLPVSVISTPTIVCAGSTATLNAATAATSYTWYPILSTGGSSLVVSPTANAVYTVAVSDGTCFGAATVAVNTNPVPTVAATPTLASICSGDQITLSATGANAYTWTPGNLSGASVTVTPNSPCAYQVVGTNSFGCQGAANLAIIVNPSPTVNISASTNFICAGNPVTVSVSGANTYTWNSGVNTTSLAVNPSVSTTYTVVGELNGCLNDTTILISVFIPTLTVTGNTSICVGETATISAGGANTYNWSNGFNTAAIQVSPTTNTVYTVSALTSSGSINCPSSASVNVQVKPLPSVTITASKNEICKGETATLTAGGANTYTWSNGSNATGISPSSSLVSTFVFSVTGTSSLNCVNTASVQLKVNSCNGLSENNMSNIRLNIYPNPNSGSFTIHAGEALSLTLSNELGQIIRRVDLNTENNYRVRLEGLSSGVYFISATNNDSKVFQKIIVNQ
jgi:hypothetical protein